MNIEDILRDTAPDLVCNEFTKKNKVGAVAGGVSAVCAIGTLGIVSTPIAIPLAIAGVLLGAKGESSVKNATRKATKGVASVVGNVVMGVGTVVGNMLNGTNSVAVNLVDGTNDLAGNIATRVNNTISELSDAFKTYEDFLERGFASLQAR